MRIKQRLDDFRVRELLAPDFLQERGEYRVYRVTKRKLTSLEAARELAYAAGVPAASVELAGLKDRQGVTTQFMTIRRGREVNLRALDLSVETAGFAKHAIESRHSLGNAFELALRGLLQEDLDRLRDNVPALRECGLVNYFDEQRFGNLRHNQGWIAQLLMRGEHEEGLKRLLASISDHDDAGSLAFKQALLAAWGNWSACRDIAGRFGKHHSVFEHLKRNEGDFAGAFYHVSSRLRLIHLYAFQSHVWNRAVADCIASHAPQAERVVLEGVEGPLVYPSKPLPLSAEATFRLPGPGLEDVSDPKQRGWLEDALARERMVAADFRIDGVPGFQLKGEERRLLVQPEHLRVRPAERDQLNFGAYVVKVRFELPRGAYATLVVRRLLSSPLQSAGRERGADRGQRDPRSRARTQVPEHRESGESLAPLRRDGFQRGERNDRGERRHQDAPRGPWQREGGSNERRAGRGFDQNRGRGFEDRKGFGRRPDFDRRGPAGGGRPEGQGGGHFGGGGGPRPDENFGAQRGGRDAGPSGGQGGGHFGGRGGGQSGRYGGGQFRRYGSGQSGGYGGGQFGRRGEGRQDERSGGQRDRRGGGHSGARGSGRPDERFPRNSGGRADERSGRDSGGRADERRDSGGQARAGGQAHERRDTGGQADEGTGGSSDAR